MELAKKWIKSIQLSLSDAIFRMFDFSGRTSRAPFWITSIIFGLFSVILLACEIWALNWRLGEFEQIIIFAFKGARYVFMFLLVSLFVRRNHDLGLSIWAVFNPLDARTNNSLKSRNFWDIGDPKANKYGPPHSLWCNRPA